MKRYSKEVKSKLRKLRSDGWSLGKLQKEFHIPKTTIHSWILDIKITKQQQEKIRIDALQALQEGRKKAQAINRRQRITKEKAILAKGIMCVGKLSCKELFIAGIALYWAEGFKNQQEHRLVFCNSDPNMVRFYIHWLEKCLFINRKNLVARLTINKVYEKRTEELEKYWSQVTDIPLSQFTKPFFQHTQWKKQYNQDNYRGVLRVHVTDSLDHFLEMKGWIEGLKLNLPG